MERSGEKREKDKVREPSVLPRLVKAFTYFQ
jgi:hypothetical protein